MWFRQLIVHCPCLLFCTLLYMNHFCYHFYKSCRYHYDRDLSAHLPFGSYAEQGMHTKAPSRSLHCHHQMTKDTKAHKVVSKLYQMILKIKPRMILSSYVGGSVLSIVDSSQRRRGWVKIQMTANASQMTAAVQRVTLLLGAKNAEHFLVKVHYSALRDKYLSSPYLAAGKFN